MKVNLIKLNYTIHTLKEKINKENFSFFVLGVDIGGTNTNLGVAGFKNSSIELILKISFKTKELQSLIPAINETLTYLKNNYDFKIKSTCIGAAGFVFPSNKHVKLTNAEWDVNINEILQKTELKKAFIINDFQAIGYGINLLDYKNANDIFIVKSDHNKNKINTTKAIIGAGTGLGKCVLVYEKFSNSFIPIPSEGGHADFPIRDQFELKLIDFIKKYRGISKPITYEELLSGRGIGSIYRFLKSTGKYKENKYSKEIENSHDKAKIISKYKKEDALSAETFKLFARYYGRCAKNFVLDTLAIGGLYIAGGIALKNKEIFKTKNFLEEFENVYRYSEILKKVPIYVIVNSDISLLGTCFAAVYLSTTK